MRVLRRTPGARRRRPRVRIPRAAVVLLACLPGLAAVLVLALCANGIGHKATTAVRRPVAARPAALRHTAPKPRIVPRSAWLDALSRHAQPPPRYDDKVVAVFVHHTDSPNGYDCADAPASSATCTPARPGSGLGRHRVQLPRRPLRDDLRGAGGGVDRAVTGAHTQGFNHRTAGIAAIGTFTAGMAVPKVMTDAIAALAAWKLGLADVDPRAKARLVSSNSLSRYASGATAVLPALAGHKDGYMTSCPGAALLARLPEVREVAARLQGR